MSYADQLRGRATHYAGMAARLLCIDTAGAACLALLALKTYRLADRMELS